jgi:hypothetical protein
MILFKWFDGKEASEFGLFMADFFANRVPVTSVPAPDKKSLQKVTEVVAKLHTQSSRFRVDHKLNIYKRAKLTNAFQWRLFDLGYDRTAVEELTRELLRSLLPGRCIRRCRETEGRR